MSGRTKRVTVAKKVYEEVESDADMEEEEKGIVTKESAPGDAYSPAAAPSKKKARKDTARQLKLATEAKAAARLSLFPEMPLDVINEVLSHLHLRDFLQIMRISKMFRSLLFSENMKGVWTAARKRLNLPLPKGLSEIQLAALCFGKSCMFCEKTGDVQFFSRTRICNKCNEIKVYIKDSAKFVQKITEAEGFHPQAQLLIPHQRDDSYPRRQWYYPTWGFKLFVWDGEVLDIKRSLRDASDQLKALSRTETDTDEMDTRAAPLTRRGAKSIAARVAIPTPAGETLESFIKEKSAWVKNIQIESKALALAFHNSQTEERRLEREESSRRLAMIQLRKTAIRAKGLELGYTDEELASWAQSYDVNYGAVMQEILHRPYPLAEEEWEKIRGVLVERLESARKYLAQQKERELSHSEALRRS